MPSSDDNAGSGDRTTGLDLPDGSDEERAEQTLLEQLGGFSGLIYSTLPVVVFVPVNSVAGLTVAIWAALGVAAAVLVWRLVRRNPIQPAISGFLGVGVCAFIAYRMGRPRDSSSSASTPASSMPGCSSAPSWSAGHWSA